MVFCEGDMPPTTELMQPELFGQDEPPCPGYDVCPVKLCGCRWLGLGTPFASDVKKELFMPVVLYMGTMMAYY